MEAAHQHLDMPQGQQPWVLIVERRWCRDRPPDEMQVHQRAAAEHDAFYLILLEQAVHSLAHAVAARVHGVAGLFGQHLGEAGETARHAEDVVVERPAVGERAGRGRIETVDQVRATTEGAEACASTEILAERHEIRVDTMNAMKAAKCEPRRHHLIEDEEGAGLRCRFAQGAEEAAVSRNTAAATHHRFYDDGGQIVAKFLDETYGSLDIVVVREG